MAGRWRVAGGVLHSLLSKYAILFAEHCIRVAVSNVNFLVKNGSIIKERIQLDAKQYSIQCIVREPL